LKESLGTVQNAQAGAVSTGLEIGIEGLSDPDYHSFHHYHITFFQFCIAFCRRFKIWEYYINYLIMSPFLDFIFT
jgi:hypothetical protein